MFYYIVRAEGYTPTEAEASAELEKLIKEYIISYLEYYEKGTTVEDYKSVEEFNSAWAAAREEVLKVYDENYFRENVLYNFGIEKLVSLADVKISRGPVTTRPCVKCHPVRPFKTFKIWAFKYSVFRLEAVP